MPNGFPAFRHDPTTEPRYVIKTSKYPTQSQPRYTDSISQPTEGPKLSKYQYPTEREPKPKKKSNPKVEGKFEKL